MVKHYFPCYYIKKETGNVTREDSELKRQKLTNLKGPLIQKTQTNIE